MTPSPNGDANHMDARLLDLPPLPRLGAPIADTHAHLDMLENPALALARAALAGVDLVVTVVDPTEDPERTFFELPMWLADAGRLLAESGAEGSHDSVGSPRVTNVPRVRVIIGAHPHNAKDFDSSAVARLRDLAADPLVAGIGEIGLDYHYDHSPRDVQRAVFEQQLAFAHATGLPAVVHLREAHEDGERILRHAGLPTAGCVLHCFTGDADLLGPFLELGCVVSFAGPVTFKKADAIRDAAVRVSLERLLVETDCPFMAPEPFRGRTNEPAYAVLTAARIADARGLDAAEFARTTHANALALFDGRER